MANITKLNILENGSIFKIKILSGPLKGVYNCPLKKIIKNREFFVECPFKKDNLSINFLNASSVIVEVSSPVGGGLYYKFNSKIIKYTDFREHSLILKFPEEVEHLNRRKYFRTKHIPNASVFGKEVIDDSGFNFLTINANILNISAGGLLLESKDNLFLNSHLNSNFILKNKKYAIKSKIVRSDQNKKHVSEFYGIEFVDLDEESRNSILKFTIEKQREDLLKNKENYLKKA